MDVEIGPCFCLFKNLEQNINFAFHVTNKLATESAKVAAFSVTTIWATVPTIPDSLLAIHLNLYGSFIGIQIDIGIV